MKASDFFLQCLEAQGVDRIFGVPGEENADIMISLLNSKIKFITCRHEQSASFMAGMYGHLTGKPGVCLATLGPGSTNLLTGVANANMDHAPLVAILGQASTHRLHKESHQNMDAVSMYQPASKWATSIRDADSIAEVVCKAFKLAAASKPGATVIELPEDIAKMEVEAAPLHERNRDYEECPSPKQVDKALELLAASETPILLVGGGCVRESCDSEVTAFVERTGMYGASTFMGKGALSAQHDHSLFCVGMGMKDIALEAFDAADLVICAGYDMVEWPPARWNEKQDKKIIHIDTLPAEVDQNYNPDVELIGNVTGALHMLNERLGDAHQKSTPAFAEVRQRIQDELDEHCHDSHFPVKPQRIVWDLRAVMAADDILISDVGAHKMWVARQYPTYQSNTCFISNGFCSMAGSIPGAFAAKQLHPDKNVVALCGDGGFMMSIQAIPTAVRYGVAFTVLLWEDEFYGLIKWKQESHYDKFSNVALHNPDLVALSQVFGCHAIRITAADQMQDALKQAFTNKDKPTVIVVPVDYSENMKLTKHLGEIVSH